MPITRRNSDDLSAPLILAAYLISFAGAWITFEVLAFFWGDLVLLQFDDLRAPQGTSMSDGIAKVWWIFLWAFTINLLIGILHHDTPRPEEPGLALLKGAWVSVNAGVFEELIYRWLVFFNVMILIPFFDLITFGLWGWMYREALVPLANWTTFGALEPQLLDHPNWVFGAAIVSASIGFRDAHKYMGWFGWINAWFGGMVLFWLMFNYGIGTAIVVHILYDLIAFGTLGLSYLWRPRATFYNIFST